MRSGPVSPCRHALAWEPGEEQHFPLERGVGAEVFEAPELEDEQRPKRAVVIASARDVLVDEAPSGRRVRRDAGAPAREHRAGGQPSARGHTARKVRRNPAFRVLRRWHKRARRPEMARGPRTKSRPWREMASIDGCLGLQGRPDQRRECAVPRRWSAAWLPRCSPRRSRQAPWEVTLKDSNGARW